MVQYFDDFEEYSTGETLADLSDWSAYDVAESTWSIGTDSNGNKCLVVSDIETTHTDVVVWDLVPSDATDVEVLMQLTETASANDDYYGMFVRLGADQSETYHNEYSEGSGAVDIDQGIDGTLLDFSGNVPDGDSGPIWVRFRINGADLMAKAWSDANSEPSGWDAEAEDFSITSGGEVGITFSPRTVPNGFFNIVSVGTEGDSARSIPFPDPPEADFNVAKQQDESVGSLDLVTAQIPPLRVIAEEAVAAIDTTVFTISAVRDTVWSVAKNVVQDYTSFTEYPTGAFPNGEDWTVEWSTNDTWEIKEVAGSKGGKALSVTANESNNAISWDGKNGSDIELLAVIYGTSGAESNIRVAIRGSGTISDRNAYICRLDGSGNLEIAKYTDDGLFIIESDTDDLSFPCFVRFRANGSDIKAKGWNVGESEPDDWQIEITDEDHSQGWAGVQQFGSAGSFYDWGQFAVGTGGASAPMVVGPETDFNVTKQQDESVGSVGSFSAQVIQALSVTAEETVAVLDVLSAQAIAEALSVTAEETVATVETVIAQAVFLRVLLATVAGSEAGETSASFVSALSERVVPEDAVETAATLSRALEEPVAVIEAIEAKASIRQSLSEAVATIDAVATPISYSRTRDAVVGVVDDVTRRGSIQQALTERLAVVEAVATSVGRRQALTETVMPVDAVAPAAAYRRTRDETVGVIDDVTVTAAFEQLASEIVASIDTVAVDKSILATLSEVVAVDESAVTAASISRALSEAVAVIDTVTPGGRLLRSLSETVGVADAVTRVPTLTALLTERVAVTEAANTAASLVRSFSSLIAVEEAVAARSGLRQALSETVAVVETATRFGTLSRSAAEIVTIAEDSNLGPTQAIMEAIAPIEAVSSLGVRKSLAARAAAIEEAVTTTTLLAPLSETVAVIEDSNLGPTQAIMEVAAPVEAVSSLGVTKSVAERVAPVEDVVATTTLLAALSETVGVIDRVTTTVSFRRALVERVAIVDDVRASIAVPLLALDETVGATDTVATIGTFVRSFEEDVAVTDTLVTSIGAVVVVMVETVGAIDQARGVYVPQYALEAVDAFNKLANLLDIRGRK